ARRGLAVARWPARRPRTLRAHDGVVGWDRAVGRDTQDLAHVLVEPLGMHPHPPVGAVAGRDVEHAVGPEGEPGAEVRRPVVGRGRAEDDTDILQATSI